MKAIEIGFILFSKRKELVIFAPTGSITNGISENIVHTTLGVKNEAEKNYQAKINV